MPGASFPKLGTGAVAQYPLEKEYRFRTGTVRFLDGKEQRWRWAATPRMSWVIRLERLTEEESAALERFFREQEGEWGSFSFEDPETGIVHQNCRLEGEWLEIEETGVSQSRCVLRIRKG